MDILLEILNSSVVTVSLLCITLIVVVYLCCKAVD